jgi:ATP-dependent RNA helicase RhlE
MSFENLGLATELLRAIGEQGYTKPTPIQSQAIPVILNGQDILAAAQTGTGKTAGFTLPMLHNLSELGIQGKKRNIRALVLTPTRELAAQVDESVKTYSKHLRLSSTVVYGGVNIRAQMQKLRKGVDILVATPGRLLDHVGQGTVDLSRIEMLVLDEADRMLDMGFAPDLKKILQLVPKQRQTLLFSATFSKEIKKLANGLLQSPVIVEVARDNAASDTVHQIVHPVDRERKRELLSYMIGDKNWQQVLVFTRTKRGADRLSKQLVQDGIRATAIHGDKSQGARTKALAQFKRGSVRALVATDVAARGIDINQLQQVINFDLPDVAEDYVHRIGRTGRAGNEGEARSLVSVDEVKKLRDIERLIKRNISHDIVEGFEPDASIAVKPVKKAAGKKPGNWKAGKRKSSSKRSGKGQAPIHADRNRGKRSRRSAGQASQRS